MNHIVCPECAYDFRPNARVQLGQFVTCPQCEIKLVVVELAPLEVDVFTPDLGVESDVASLAKRKRREEVPCPECGEDIQIGGHLAEGQLVECPWCRSSLTVISIDPLELEPDLLGIDISSAKIKNRSKHSPPSSKRGKKKPLGKSKGQKPFKRR